MVAPHAVYVKNRNWVDYSPSVAVSWAMKYICKVKKDCSDRLHSTSWLTATSYSIKVIYQNLCDQIPKVNWHYFVWNRYTLPKNRVTIWLALHDRLKTKERLHRYGVTMDETCALCGHDTETSAHLFFKCHFSKECCSMVLAWLGFISSRNNLFTLLKWIHRYCKNSFTMKVVYAAVASTVYQIRKARNLAIWEQFVPSIACTVKTIQVTVKHRVMSIIVRNKGY
ncbi:uncharacterized protein [Spinacia oleracea]|uniref:Reverse transcriptase zinc-binding domain-containing protein n=1 Tax=Spinacia oleracea TaxID=3562 RepID=A0A9R0IR52_SPIOL|nr:uncharacterized protein LOC110793457 [Spinacia oleracea]